MRLNKSTHLLFYVSLLSMAIIFWVKSLAHKIDFPAFNLDLLIVMWSVIFATFLFAFFATPPVKNALAVSREMFYALFIMLYIASFAFQRRIYS